MRLARVHEFKCKICIARTKTFKGLTTQKFTFVARIENTRTFYQTKCILRYTIHQLLRFQITQSGSFADL